MIRYITIALTAALAASVACIVEWPEECDPAVPQPCEDSALICEISDPDEPDYGFCVVPFDGARCGAGFFPCDGDQCRPDGARCNSAFDCRDGNDEADCGCGAGQFLCPGLAVSDGCRPMGDRCNGSTDCPGGADEQGC